MKPVSDKKDEKVIFFADSHTYWYGPVQLNSMGKFLKPLFNPFEDNYWLTHCTLKDIYPKKYKAHYDTFPMHQRRTGHPANELFPPFLHITPPINYARRRKLIERQWDKKRYESQYKGTKFHEERESENLKDGYIFNKGEDKRMSLSPINPKKGDFFYDNESILPNLAELPDGAYTELLIYNLEYDDNGDVTGLAGQADMVFIETVNGVRYIDIDDHKTNEKKPPKSGAKRCRGVISHLYDCDHTKYEMQVNGYAYMMSLAGFTPRHLGYTWYKNYQKEVFTYVPVTNHQKIMPLIFKELAINDLSH